MAYPMSIDWEMIQYPWTALALHKRREMSRHGFPVMCDQHSILAGSQGEHFRIRQPTQARRGRGLEVGGRLSTFHTQDDILIQVGVRLKTGFQRRGVTAVCRAASSLA